MGRVPGALPRGGEINRLRFEAEQIDFTPEGWEAKNIQITNDPFSPPELVLKADKATLTRLSPLRDEVRATRPRLVFDQRVSIPLLISRTVLDRRERQPPLVQFGFDNEDRGGLFVERDFELIRSDKVRFRLTPQIYLQRMVFETKDVTDPDNFGAKARLDVQVTPTTSVRAAAKLTTFDTEKFLDNLRASIRATQRIDTPVGPHRLAFEYSYRDRLFNGSLGFQTVQSSLGFIFVSPDVVLGNTGLTLNYQAGYSDINANTDRLDLLGPNPEDSRVTLGRFQASAALNRNFTLWEGKPLPATRNEGLKYTANPVIPYLLISTSVRGVFSSYTSDDTQKDFIGTVGLYGQFGHFSRPFFDYTAFSVLYQQTLGGGSSPFFFDRTVDNRVLSLSLFQQIYGPFRFGVQTSFNLDTRESISTDYFLEYSRRTHGIIVRYNPVLEIGSISFRISDFNWTGGTEPFAGSDVIPVEGGVRRTSD
ncbi:MAG: DUF3769 domain-containing protein [Leptolyngbyaceae cyanobacterium RU_5_1]|nr:DUF3769 domain-containing protein [Leptolyngbyaceae cyanobacterium RU_5_1]